MFARCPGYVGKGVAIVRLCEKSSLLSTGNTTTSMLFRVFSTLAEKRVQEAYALLFFLVLLSTPRNATRFDSIRFDSNGVRVSCFYAFRSLRFLRFPRFSSRHRVGIGGSEEKRAGIT